MCLRAAAGPAAAAAGDAGLGAGHQEPGAVPGGDGGLAGGGPGGQRAPSGGQQGGGAVPALHLPQRQVLGPPQLPARATPRPRPQLGPGAAAGARRRELPPELRDRLRGPQQLPVLRLLRVRVPGTLRQRLPQRHVSAKSVVCSWSPRPLSPLLKFCMPIKLKNY